MFSKSSYTILYSQQKSSKVPISPHPHQHLLCSGFLIIAVLTDCEVVSHFGIHLHPATLKVCVQMAK